MGLPDSSRPRQRNKHFLKIAPWRFESIYHRISEITANKHSRCRISEIYFGYWISNGSETSFYIVLIDKFRTSKMCGLVEPVNSKFSVKVHPLVLGHGIETSEFTDSQGHVSQCAKRVGPLLQQRYCCCSEFPQYMEQRRKWEGKTGLSEAQWTTIKYR